MKRSRPFTAYSPVALRLGICALVAAAVILPVAPPFASEQLVETSAIRLAPIDTTCSARHWNRAGICFLAATEEAPARVVRIVTFERSDGDVSTLQRRAVPSGAR